MNPSHYVDQIIEWLEESGFGPIIAWTTALVTLTFAGIKWWPQIKAGVQYIDVLMNLAKLMTSVKHDLHEIKTALPDMHGQIETIRAEVQNSHTMNLRDDMDRKHDELAGELRGMRRDIGRADLRVLHQSEEIRTLEHTVAEHLEWSKIQEGRIDSLEDTIDPKEES